MSRYGKAAFDFAMGAAGEYFGASTGRPSGAGAAGAAAVKLGRARQMQTQIETRQNYQTYRQIQATKSMGAPPAGVGGGGAGGQ